MPARSRNVRRTLNLKMPNQSARDDVVAAAGSTPILLLLFVGSGCAALVYEIVWFQMLELVIGSTGVSLGVLLGTFMGGMSLGSLVLPRLIPIQRHPLRVYALIEAGIGVLGLILLLAIPLVSGVYTDIVGRGLPGILLRALVAALLLLPPTVLMGATLPAIARWVETTPRGVSWMGFFYGGNIAGAVLGSLLAGFYLLRVHDIYTATIVAVAINASVATIAFLLGRRHAYRHSNDEAEPAPVFTSESRTVYVVIALSGLSALGAEVVWTRVLSLLLGASVYTFSIILAVFLAGLGIGSGVGSYLIRVLRRPRVALGLCQLGVVLGIAWTAMHLNRILPFWPVNEPLTQNPWLIFHLDVVRTTWSLLPATLFWGASFPLAVAAAAARDQDPAQLMGGVYASNTVGAIVGALGVSTLAIPAIGTQQSQQLLIGIAAVSALLVLVPAVLRAGSRKPGAAADKSPAPSLLGIGGLAAALGLVALLAKTVPPLPTELVAYGRIAMRFAPPNPLYVGEGMNSSVAVTGEVDGVRSFHVSGKVEATTTSWDMRLQRMLSHVSALLHDGPESVLVVGFGAGVTAGSFVVHPTVHRLVIAEIEPLIPEKVAPYFARENYYVLEDPRADLDVEVVYDDARHYIGTTDEKFDIITSDPIHPWVKGAASLYTREYFEMARARLNPGGVMTIWVPLYESSPEAVKSQLATFFEVFPNGTVWSNAVESRGYDLVVAGKLDPGPIELDHLDARLAQPDFEYVNWSLRDVGFESYLDLLATFAGSSAQLEPWLRDAEINRDRNLRIMYTAGLSLNVYDSPRMFEEMQRNVTGVPADLFVGSDSLLAELRSRIR